MKAVKKSNRAKPRPISQESRAGGRWKTPLTIDDVQTEFIAVDLNVWSVADPAPFIRALANRLGVHYVGRVARKHWVQVILLYQPQDPTDAILGFAKVLRRLPPDAREIWDQAKKEFDIGFQGGLEPRSGEWVVDAKALRIAADCGAQLRVTIYSPKLALK